MKIREVYSTSKDTNIKGICLVNKGNDKRVIIFAGSTIRKGNAKSITGKNKELKDAIIDNPNKMENLKFKKNHIFKSLSQAGGVCLGNNPGTNWFKYGVYYSKNVIFYGVPGSGKSRKVKDIIEIFDGECDRSLFYPEYSYSDFVDQNLPYSRDGVIDFKFKPGPFTRILADALNESAKMYFLVIEEINRGNAPAIFGDMFQILDRRVTEEKKEDGYRKGDSEYFIENEDVKNWLIEEGKVSEETLKNGIYIPDNLYIFATMNTSDQNVFILDTAFKRRWNMQYVKIDWKDCELSEINIPLKSKREIKLKDFVDVLNERIPKLNVGINGEDKLIGQYFVTKEELSDAKLFIHKVFMYLWNDVAKINRSELFDTSIKTFEQLIDKVESKGIEVFTDDIKIELEKRSCGESTKDE